jgi:hypothetical protein
MTKDEMLKKFYSKCNSEDNYAEAQRRIKEAMQAGEKYVYLPGKDALDSEFDWICTSETASRLKEDGFNIGHQPPKLKNLAA